jgi:hypothetical protein
LQAAPSLTTPCFLFNLALLFSPTPFFPPNFSLVHSLAKLGEKHGVELTMFHGKGGTVSRGGNPSMYKALIAQPPGTLNNRLRITEQGRRQRRNGQREGADWWRA